MASVTQTEISDAIVAASRKAFTGLFQEHPGEYYYCALVTSGEAHPPVVSAWSHEALSVAAAATQDPEEARQDLKWSPADSPYYSYGSQHFRIVNALFAQRPRLTADLSEEEWAAEYELRLAAMEEAMARLDAEGIFGRGRKRLGLVVLVEVVPPDHTNTDRALRLNPPEALGNWLEEAAED